MKITNLHVHIFKLVLILFCLFTISITVLAQEDKLEERELWIQYESDFALDEEQHRETDPYLKESFSSSEDLNNLFLHYGVTDYEKAIPWSRNPAILNIYSVVCTCNIDSLAADLETLLKENIVAIKVIEIGGELILLNDKGDFNSEDNNIYIYPNPIESNEWFNIVLPKNITKANFKLYNSIGETTMGKSITSNNASFVLENTKPGLYYFLISISNKTSKTGKLIITEN